jgi:hypothetical protein
MICEECATFFKYIQSNVKQQDVAMQKFAMSIKFDTNK